MMFSLDRIEETLQKAPSLEPFLRKLAKKAATGKRIPASFTVRGLDYEAQGALGHFFGTVCGRTADGVVYGNILEFYREPRAWRPVIAYFEAADGEERPSADDAETMFTRLAWAEPGLVACLNNLKANSEVQRFVRQPENDERWYRLYLSAVKLVRDENSGAMTLSQLGSDWFNDSKCLRSGALRRQLALILGVFSDLDPDDERSLFGNFGIVDNPYTSFVTFFAPVVLEMQDGSRYDYPLQLFKSGLACQLPLETVEKLRQVEWSSDYDSVLVTSENAAPFADWVRRGKPSLYTEGYCNYAVQGLLRRLAEAGVEAEHEGDADLDGLRIAEGVGCIIPLKRVVAMEILANPGRLRGIPLTESQLGRLARFMEDHPDFIGIAALRRLRELSSWFEQESFHEA